MTTYISEQVDQLRDLLEDPTDTQVTFALKLHYLNAGQRAMWPRIYRIVTDATAQFVDDTYEYTIPAAVRGGRMFQLERSSADYPTVFFPISNSDYNIYEGAGGADLLRITFDPNSAYADGYIRYSTALPLSTIVAANYAASQALAYTGPDYSVEGPVLYAMSRINARPLDRRLDFTRTSVQQMNRGATPQELLAVSAYWLDEFERRLDEWRMALPGSRF